MLMHQRHDDRRRWWWQRQPFYSRISGKLTCYQVVLLSELGWPAMAYKSTGSAFHMKGELRGWFGNKGIHIATFRWDTESRLHSLIFITFSGSTYNLLSMKKSSEDFRTYGPVATLHIIQTSDYAIKGPTMLERWPWQCGVCTGRLVDERRQPHVTWH